MATTTIPLHMITTEASDYLAALGIRLKPSTLATWRSQGKGPEFIKKLGRVYYTKKSLDNFVKGKTK